MTFIATRRETGRWVCRRQGPPHGPARGHDPYSAFRRCCRRLGGDPRGFRPVRRTEHSAVFRRPAACPDCGGNGRYVGLAAVEPCRACRGRGTV